MDEQKKFLTYNQQMKKLREEKKISCGKSTDKDHSIQVGSSKDKERLVRMGYFNIVNGYKEPFTCGRDAEGKHVYIKGTSLEQIYHLKKFDEKLRLFLLKYITQVEEEVRTLTGYKFDQCNDNGKVSWYETSAYDSSKGLQKRMDAISSAYGELSRSQLDYVKFYMEKHSSIPTWIMIKVINFSTFIKVLQNSKKEVIHALCRLYDMMDANGKSNVKLLVGSLHWLRKVRNSCAHNERVYCIQQTRGKRDSNTGRILERYFSQLRKPYSKDSDKRIMDLLVYMKYYLPDKEFRSMINELSKMLRELETQIPDNAFANIRGQMGIKKLDDLDALAGLKKEKISYNKFDIMS